MDDFFQRLREERKRLGLSQEGLAALVSVSKNTQSNYETGASQPDVGYLKAIQAAGLDAGFVLTGLRTFDPSAVSHPQPMLTIATRLRQERERLGMTVAELARKAGIETQAMKQFEAGKAVPDATALQQLHAAGVDVGYVLLSLRSNALPQALSEDEQGLLQDYAKASEQGRALVRGVAALAARE